MPQKWPQAAQSVYRIYRRDIAKPPDQKSCEAATFLEHRFQFALCRSSCCQLRSRQPPQAPGREQEQ